MGYIRDLKSQMYVVKESLEPGTYVVKDSLKRAEMIFSVTAVSFVSEEISCEEDQQN